MDTVAQIIQMRSSDAEPVDAWQVPPQINSILSRVTQVTDVINLKGDVLPSTSDYRPVPASLLNDQASAVVLSSPAISLAGSFAPIVTDAGFSVLVQQDGFTIFYDGTNQSRQIKMRRSDGYSITLPKGQLSVTNLTPGPAGGTAPSFDVLPYFLQGSCNIGWVFNPATQGFYFPTGTVTADFIAQQRSKGREALSDGPITIQLQAVPAAPPPTPTPPPAQPTTGTQAGNTAVNGPLTLVVDSPGQNAIVDQNFTVQAHASDSAGNVVTGWLIYVDSVTPAAYNNPGPVSQVSAPFSLAIGPHELSIQVWNAQGTMCVVTLPITCQQITTPAPPPPAPDPPTPIHNCVMLGTDIAVVGEHAYHTQRLPQNEWVRIYTDAGKELIATPDHPVYTSRAGRTEMRDVRKGDFVVTNNGEAKVMEKKEFLRPGVKVSVHMTSGHLFYANGFLSHNTKYTYNTL